MNATFDKPPKVFVVAPSIFNVEIFAERIKGCGIEFAGATKGYPDAKEGPESILKEIQKHTDLNAVVIFGWINGYFSVNREGEAVAQLVAKHIPRVSTIGLVGAHDKGEFTVDHKVKAMDTDGLIAAILFSTL